MRPQDIKYHVVHCTYTPEDMDIGISHVREWHLRRGWKDVGYHFLIRRDGTLEVGRPWWVVGAHCRGINNRSIATALVGGQLKDGDFVEAVCNYTPYQRETLIEHMENMCHWLPPQVEHCGHNDFTNEKSCPNFKVREWWAAPDSYPEYFSTPYTG